MDKLKILIYGLFSAALIIFCKLLIWPEMDLNQINYCADQAKLIHQADRILDGVAVKLGPHSKADTFMPGPLYFYFLALIKLISGNNPLMTHLLLSFIKFGTVIILSLLAYRLRAPFPLVILLPLVIAGSDTFFYNTKIIWSPAITLPVFSLLVYLAIKLEDFALPPIALLLFLTSFLIQTHLALTPVLLALWIYIFIIIISNRSKTAPGAYKKIALRSVLVLVICWSPPLYEMFINKGGNLKKLLFFHIGGARVHEPGEVFSAINQFLAPLFSRMEISSIYLLLVTCLVAAILGTIYFFRINKTLFRFNLLTISLTTVFVLSLLGVSSKVEYHYLYYGYTIVFCLLLAPFILLDALLVKASRSRHVFTGLISVILLIISLPPLYARKDMFKNSEWNTCPLGELKQVVLKIKQEQKNRPFSLLTRGKDAPANTYPILLFFQKEKLNISSLTVPGSDYRLYTPPETDGSEGALVLKTNRYRLMKTNH